MLFEIVRRCLYCRREMAVSEAGYAQNPYCKHCVDERIDAVKLANKGTRWQSTGTYTQPIKARK